LFVGAATVEMAEALKIVGEQDREDFAKKKTKQLVKATQSGTFESWWEQGDDEHQVSIADINERQQAASLLLEVFYGSVIPVVMLEEKTLARRVYWKMAKIARRVTHSRRFAKVVVGLLVCTAITLGCETIDSLMENKSYALFDEICNIMISIAFLLEVILKIMTEGFRPWRYFVVIKRGTGKVSALKLWNLFDTFVVFAVISLVPYVFG
jgi:hypothetical protein